LLSFCKAINERIRL
jgi:hypothetical protein